MPPKSWTSKWRCPKTRFAASRTKAKASGKISSTVFRDSIPVTGIESLLVPRRSLNYLVLFFNCSPESFSKPLSKELIFSTVGRCERKNRSFESPKIFPIIDMPNSIRFFYKNKRPKKSAMKKLSYHKILWEYHRVFTHCQYR